MQLLVDFQLPLSDPVQKFTVILLVILFAPLLFTRFRIPGVIGLILAGTVIGPHGLNILEQGETTLFGTVGLLYIMFVAGLEIDLVDFSKNRKRSLGFGAFTFFIPLLIGTLVSYYFLDYPLRSSILLASMFATHTLIAYPIASRLGIARNEAVTVTVGGTMITDTAALMILVLITASVKGTLNTFFWIQLVVSTLLFTVLVLWGFPKIARWFFRNAEQDGVVQYTFTLMMVFLAAFLAELAGLEPIIGAFLAGLALNRLVPHTSVLMSRIEFIGNALFIPFFLINVGMLVDPGVVFRGSEALIVAFTLTSVALLSKLIAAHLTQWSFGFSILQRNVIFGLSSAHAAATIAIILIAYNLELLDENVLNGTVVLILITCMVSSFITDRAGRKLAVEAYKPPPSDQQQERILVPVANPANMEQLIDLAVMIKQQDDGNPVYSLSVVLDDEGAKENLWHNQASFEKARKHATAANQMIHPISRVDMNASSGIIRASKEMGATKIVMGWNGNLATKDRLFGSVLDHVVSDTEQEVMVVKLLNPLNTFRRIVLWTLPNAEAEIGFSYWVTTLGRLCNKTTGVLHYYGSSETGQALMHELQMEKASVQFVENHIEAAKGISSLVDIITPSDLLVITSTRENTVSYHPMIEKIPTVLSNDFRDLSFLVIYPKHALAIPSFYK
ncbi:Kef-type K+ transport system membrane component KefB/nucleotide-binding universal stress UspA family protein [Catalinimonas alkaloidigena]|uniref:cation:proton antiporter n=1 Tax=Catalinimonas alkaloidigena TaxID=1075417 RepID=UPI002407255C|nr:cation:proton antiporter [Catalinimonas alkaloidigena]MDF9797816.1 Kef-type K+ transport system membrane component KefB/nucleotide-binding universal stress UspA family protein [Catalinimonas alkaloidigena]